MAKKRKLLDKAIKAIEDAHAAMDSLYAMERDHYMRNAVKNADTTLAVAMNELHHIGRYYYEHKGQ